MLELASSLLAALDAGRTLAVATVVAIDGSAPRALGTSMAVDDLGQVIGSISGGCVEGAVYDACTRVLDDGAAELCAFGFSDDDAFAVGLSCGGRLSVVVQELGRPGARNAVSPALRTELERAAAGRSAAIALVLEEGNVQLVTAHAEGLGPVPSEPPPSGTSGLGGGGERARARVADELRASIHAGRTVRRAVECDGDVVEAVFLVAAPPPRLIVFGAVDFSVALSNAAALLGYRVTVCDARPVFATARRFPAAEVVTRWPTDYLAETEVDERTAICILTHDDKFDVPLIEAALQRPIAYLGAMGSRRTHERRMAKLRERGVDEGALESLHSPIGLDLGASSPEETAVSILAEILAVRASASGRSLKYTSGAIHPPVPAGGAVVRRAESR